MYGNSSDLSQAFSIARDTDDYNQFMFASSGLHFFLIADKSEIIEKETEKNIIVIVPTGEGMRPFPCN